MRFVQAALPGLLSAAVLAGCVSSQPENLGLVRFLEPEIMTLVQQGAVFRSGRDETVYRVHRNGHLDITDRAGRRQGSWQIRDDEFCAAVPAGAAMDCFKVFSASKTMAGPFHFQGRMGHLSEGYAYAQP